MDRISAEEYLNEAINRIGRLVSECVNVDLRKAKDEYYLRVIFPCWIYAGGTEKRPLYDLPYIEHCKFTYVVVERYIKVQETKDYEKIRKHLAASKDFQAAIGRITQGELLNSLHGTSDEYGWTYALADVITRYAKLKGEQPSVYASCRAQAIEFYFRTGRTVPLTAGGMMYCVPSKSLLKRISKKLHDDYLRDFLDQDSAQNDWFRPKGWMENNIVPFYCGKKDLNYGNLNTPIKWEEGNSLLSLKEIERILALVPYYISIPLFSFAIFSVLKFFYPKYPSRISIHDTYERVTRKVKKVLYVSLEGKNRVLTQEAAELYCGSFLRRSLGGTPARQNEGKYVHDGIAIYSENIKKKYKITEKNIDSYLVMDACALFVDIQLPQDERAVKVTWDNMFCGISSNALHKYRDKVDLLICHFITWMEDYFHHKLNQYAESNNQEYDRLVSELNFGEEYRLWKGAFDRKIEDIIDQAFDSSKEKLGAFAGSPGRKENFAYLLSSFYIFTLYLAASYDAVELNRIAKIKTIGVNTLCELCCGTASAESIVSIFSRYISHLFETNAVVSIRGEAKGRVSGWYDPKRNHLLLPYASYYEKFLGFCRKKNFDRVPSSKSKFQSEILAASGFIQLKQNGKNSSYFRADCKVQVAPVGTGKIPKESVIRISLEPFQGIAPLSTKALKAINTLIDQPASRRAPNR